VPNGLGQSHLGVKGVERIASDWSLVFKFENGFDPYTLQRANGPKSLVQNNTTPLDAQTANGDSSRAGQLFNTEAYVGFSHPTYGELTAGRQNTLVTDGLGRADPMGAAPSFSLIGVSKTAAGVETPRRLASILRSNIASAWGRSISPRFISSAATIRATARTGRFRSG